METEQKLQIVRAIYGGFSSKNLAAILEHVDKDVIVAQTRELPWGGDFKGHEGVKEFFSTLLASIDSQVEVQRMFVAGERVIVAGRTRGKVRSNGRPFDVDFVHVWSVADGKANRFYAHIDTPKMLAALRG